MAANASSPTTAFETNSWISPERSRIVAKTSLPESRSSMMRPATATLVVGLDTRFQLAPRRTDLGHGVGAVEAVRIRRAACRSHLVELGEPPCLLGGEPAPGVQG